MEAAMPGVATRSRMPAMEDAVLPEPKRSKSILPPLTCDGNIAFECPTGSYRGKCTLFVFQFPSHIVGLSLVMRLGD